MTNFVNSIYEEYITGDKVNQIIIDIGCFHTKVGYSQEPEPREILNTPELFDYKSYYNDLITNVLNEDENQKPETIDIMNYKYNYFKKCFVLKVEEFVFNILYNVLQIHKKKREKNYNCILLCDFNPQFQNFFKLIVDTLINSNLIADITLMNSLITPLYTSGVTSGIVVNLGTLNSTIIPIYNNYIYKKYIKKINVSVLSLHKNFILKILLDNYIQPVAVSATKSKGKSTRNVLDLNKIISTSENQSQKLTFNSQDIEQITEDLNLIVNELFVKSIVCLNRKLINDLLSDGEVDKVKDNKSDTENKNTITFSNANHPGLGSDKKDYINKLRNDYNKIELPSFKNLIIHNQGTVSNNIISSVKTIAVSLLTRIFLGESLFDSERRLDNESILYKNPKCIYEGEVNIAREILNLLLDLSAEVRLKTCQNIILSGGLSMTIGLFKRFSDEIVDLLENENQYSVLKGLKEKVKVHKILYSKNCLSWIGGKLNLFR